MSNLEIGKGNRKKKSRQGKKRKEKRERERERGKPAKLHLYAIPERNHQRRRKNAENFSLPIGLASHSFSSHLIPQSRSASSTSST